MAKILQFPNKVAVKVRDGREHVIGLKVLDRFEPELTRWMAQFHVQKARFNAHRGFTDESVAAGRKHSFDVSSTRAVRKFVARTLEMVEDQRLAVWVDGVRVRPFVAQEA